MEAMSNKIINVLRWIIFIPGAALGSWLAWTFFNATGKFSFWYVGVDSDWFISQLYFETAGPAAMGAAFIFVGAKIAPSHRKIVAYILAGLGCMISGFTLFSGITVGNGWTIWGSFCLAIGIGVFMYSIYLGEINIE